MGLLSLLGIAITFFAAFFVLKNVQVFAGFLKNKKQDEVIIAQSKRIDELEKRFGVMLDIVLELDEVDAGDFSKRLLQAQYER